MAESRDLNLKELGELAEDKAIEFFNADRLDHYQEQLIDGKRPLQKLTVGGFIQCIRGLHRHLKVTEAENAALRERVRAFDRMLELNIEKVAALESQLENEKRAKEQTVDHYRSICDTQGRKLDEILKAFGVKEHHEIFIRKQELESQLAEAKSEIEHFKHMYENAEAAGLHLKVARDELASMNVSGLNLGEVQAERRFIERLKQQLAAKDAEIARLQLDIYIVSNTIKTRINESYGKRTKTL